MRYACTFDERSLSPAVIDWKSARSDRPTVPRAVISNSIFLSSLHTHHLFPALFLTATQACMTMFTQEVHRACTSTYTGGTAKYAAATFSFNWRELLIIFFIHFTLWPQHWDIIFQRAGFFTLRHGDWPRYAPYIQGHGVRLLLLLLLWLRGRWVRRASKRARGGGGRHKRKKCKYR